MPFDDGPDDESVPMEQEALLPSEIAQMAVAATSPGPEASSTAPPTEGTTPAASDQGEGDPPPAFDERHREEFSGLLYLGALQDEFDWAGHRFVIRTLTTGELLEVALVQKRYRDSIGDSRAYITALVAACTVSVDGKPLPRPISVDPVDTEFANRFAYVKDYWFPWVLDAIYERYMKLEGRVTEILDAMGKAQPSAVSTAG